MDRPVILFIPVSSIDGIGEYTRSVILAKSLIHKIPEAVIHFILNKYVSYTKSCPFNVHLSEHSATKDSAKVKSVMQELRPNLVIFDCAGRSQHFILAKSLGAKVIFISQHKKKRARGLKLKRLLNCDLHWVVQPDYAIAPLTYFERLKLKIFNKKAPKCIGAIVAKTSPVGRKKTLQKYSLVKNKFFIFSAGSGAHKNNNQLVADVFYQASVEFQQKSKINTLMIFGHNYPEKLPEKSPVICLRSVSSSDFVVMLNESKGRVIGAGDTLLQAIELKKPCVAVAVSKDQPARLQACSTRGLVLESKTTSQDICVAALALIENDNYSSIKLAIKNSLPNSGLNVAIEDMIYLLNEQKNHSNRL